MSWNASGLILKLNDNALIGMYLLKAYRKYPTSVRTQVKTISDPNYLVRILSDNFQGT